MTSEKNSSAKVRRVERLRRCVGRLLNRNQRIGRSRLVGFGRRVAVKLQAAEAHLSAGTFRPALAAWSYRRIEYSLRRRRPTPIELQPREGGELQEKPAELQQARPGPQAAPDTAEGQTARVLAALVGRTSLDHSPDLSDEVIVDAATLLHDPALPTILFLVHCRGGEAQVRLRALIAALAGRANALVLQGDQDERLRLLMAPRVGLEGLRFRVPEGMDALVRLLRKIQVRRVDVHHVGAFEEQAVRLLDALGVPYDVTLVDYHLVARDPHLRGPDGRFVGEAEAVRRGDGGMLRPKPSAILRCADRVLAVSRDLMVRVARMHPELPTVAARRWSEIPAEEPILRPLREGERLEIVVAGDLDPDGDGGIVLDVARLLAARSLPVELHVMGEFPIASETRDVLEGVLHHHGPVQSTNSAKRFDSIGPHLGWLPAQAPETWGRALDNLMSARLPIAASDLGAVRERCAARPATWLLPYDVTAADWVAFFEELIETELRLPPRWSDIDDLPEAEDVYFDAYLAPLRRQHQARNSPRAPTLGCATASNAAPVGRRSGWTTVTEAPNHDRTTSPLDRASDGFGGQGRSFDP